jgi:hypothetical protein
MKKIPAFAATLGTVRALMESFIFLGMVKVPARDIHDLRIIFHCCTCPDQVLAFDTDKFTGTVMSCFPSIPQIPPTPKSLPRYNSTIFHPFSPDFQRPDSSF